MGKSSFTRFRRYSPAERFFQTRPWTMTWQYRSESGFRRIGFISYVAKSPAASACKAWARPISNPSMVAAEFRDIFCALKGATRRPERMKIRHRAVVRIDLPTCDAVPSTIKDRALIGSHYYRKRVAYWSCVLNSFCGLPCASPTIIAVLVPPANSFAWIHRADAYKLLYAGAV